MSEGLLFPDEIDTNKRALFDLNPKVLPLLQQTRVSQETKNLLKMMLVLDEDARIDWEELFQICDSVKTKIDVGINTINENTNKRYLKRIH